MTVTGYRAASTVIVASITIYVLIGCRNAFLHPDECSKCFKRRTGRVFSHKNSVVQWFCNRVLPKSSKIPRSFTPNKQTRIVTRSRNEGKYFARSGFECDDSAAFIDHQLRAVFLKFSIDGELDVVSSNREGVVNTFFIWTDIFIKSVFLNVFNAFFSAQDVFVLQFDSRRAN